MQDIETTDSLVSPSPQRLAACSTERARKLVSLIDAEKMGLLPLALVEHNGVQTLAGVVSIGASASTAQAITFRFGIRCKLVEVSSELLNEAITIAYKRDGLALASAAKFNAPAIPESNPTAKGNILWMPSQAGAAQLFAELIEHGAARGASDIAVVPLHDGCEVRLKINGELHRWNGRKITRPTYLQLVRRAKALANLDPTIQSLPQDGSFEGARGLRARLSTLPTIHGENLVIRLMSNRIRSLDDLGLTSVVRERLECWIASPNGLVVFAGPTGAGKSASLYACMRELAKRGVGVASVEDPVEQEIVGTVQSQVSQGLSFARVTRAVLRQAPDVLVVGEVRDSETAMTLIDAATTGHLVLCSVHGGSVKEVVSRFTHFGISQAMLASVLKGMGVQRLLPRLCEYCRVVDIASGGYREVGCSHCAYTGYDGRVLVVETYSHPRFALELSYDEPALQSWESAVAQLVSEGVISNKTAAIVRW